MVNPNHDACPADVLDLLPWYPDGGLSDDERGRVEAHAALCAECRCEIQAWERGEGVLPEDAPSAERMLARIFERIAAPETVLGTSSSKAEPRLAPVTGAGSGWRQDRGVAPARTARLSRRERMPARWRYGQAAAAVLALSIGLAGGRVIERWRTPAEALYRTATAPPESVSPRESAASPTVDVVLRDDVPAGRVGEVLRAVGAQIISGPSAVGRYQLRLAPGTDATAVAKLLSAPGTGVAAFAQPLP
jgi:anti-sigma factor RsiW